MQDEIGRGRGQRAAKRWTRKRNMNQRLAGDIRRRSTLRGREEERALERKREGMEGEEKEQPHMVLSSLLFCGRIITELI